MYKFYLYTLNIFAFNSAYMCVSVCASMHMNAGAQAARRSRIFLQLSYIQL